MDEAEQRSDPGDAGKAYPGPGSGVVVNAMLCDGAFVMNDLVYVKGGVRHVFAGSGSPLQVSAVGIGAHIEPSPRRSSGRHMLQVRLREIGDGKASAELPLGWRAQPGNSGAEPVVVLEYQLEYQSRRPAEPTAAGDRVRIPFAVNFTGLEVPSPGDYEFVLSIDGLAVCSVPFRVDQTPG